MPVYEYTALDAKGKTTSGIIDADGAGAARQKLRATGIFPVSIKESQGAPVITELQLTAASNGAQPEIALPKVCVCPWPIF